MNWQMVPKSDVKNNGPELLTRLPMEESNLILMNVMNWLLNLLMVKSMIMS